MNHNNVFYALAILITIMGCGPEKFKQDFSSGKAIMMLNGDEWIGSAGASLLLRDTAYIQFEKFNSYGDLRQSISFSKIPCMVGEYRLYESVADSVWLPRAVSAFATLSSDGDVLEDYYYVLREAEMTDNTISIVEWNASENFLRGYFDVSYFLKPGQKANPANPDTIVVRSGEFSIKL